MKKRLRQKRTRKRDEDRLAQSIKQMETALDGDFSHVTVHTVGLTKKHLDNGCFFVKNIS